MNMSLTNKLLLLIITCAAISAGIWLGYVTQVNNQSVASRTPSIQGAILPQPKALDDIHLYSVNNQTFSVEDLKHDWSLVFVGYTNCPDVCPMTLSVLNQVHILMEEQDLTPPRIIFISIDPQRDTPELIDQYVKYFNESFIGITGNKEDLQSVTRQMSVVYAKAPGADGSISNDSYLMDHSSSLILVNPDAKVQSFLTAPHTPMQIIDSIVRSQVFYKQLSSISAM